MAWKRFPVKNSSLQEKKKVFWFTTKRQFSTENKLPFKKSISSTESLIFCYRMPYCINLITESPTLEKTTKVTQSNHQTIPTMPTKYVPTCFMLLVSQGRWKKSWEKDTSVLTTGKTVNEHALITHFKSGCRSIVPIHSAIQLQERQRGILSEPC